MSNSSGNAGLAERPIFVRGLSRSGGTLVVTILDSHPDVAMSYELYPNLLELEDPTPNGLRKVIDRLEPEKGRRFADRVDNSRFRTFLYRLPRGGLAADDVIGVFRAHMDEGMGVAAAERIRLVERFARWKANREGKARWGLKCLGAYDEYLAVFPDAAFVNIIRDGRDVLASTLREMKTERTVTQIANGWVSTHQRFREIMDRPDVTATEVFYEELVQNPAPVIRGLCEVLGLPYSSDLLNHNKHAHSIYSASHLSLERIRQPIDPSSIGRWRRELTTQQLDELLEIAGDMMRLLGYTQ